MLALPEHIYTSSTALLLWASQDAPTGCPTAVNWSPANRAPWAVCILGPISITPHKRTSEHPYAPCIPPGAQGPGIPGAPLGPTAPTGPPAAQGPLSRPHPGHPYVPCTQRIPPPPPLGPLLPGEVPVSDPHDAAVRPTQLPQMCAADTTHRDPRAPGPARRPVPPAARHGRGRAASPSPAPQPTLNEA